MLTVCTLKEQFVSIFCEPTYMIADGVHFNALSLAAALRISSLKRGGNNVFSDERCVSSVVFRRMKLHSSSHRYGGEYVLEAC